MHTDFRTKEPSIFLFQFDAFLFIGCVLRNQPEEVLERFLKLLLEMLYGNY